MRIQNQSQNVVYCWYSIIIILICCINRSYSICTAGYKQNPTTLLCEEICGDGKRFNNNVDYCDDGNSINGDGCSSSCNIEQGYICQGGSEFTVDICKSTSKITLKVLSSDEKLKFLNKISNEIYNIKIEFSIEFSLPLGKSIKDFIQLQVEGVSKSIDKILTFQVYTDPNQPLIYDISINFMTTLKKRKLIFDFIQPEQFIDKYGNTLENTKVKLDVLEYVYTSNETRTKTKDIELFIKGLTYFLLLFVLPFLFVGEFNKVGFALDQMQFIVFLGFLDIQYPLNGFHFFKLAGMYSNFSLLPNFIGQGSTFNLVPDDSDFSNRWNNVQVLDNCGGIISVLFLFVFLHLVLRILYKILNENKSSFQLNSKRKIYKILIKFFELGFYNDYFFGTSTLFIGFSFLYIKSYSFSNIASGIIAPLFVLISIFIIVTMFVLIRKRKYQIHQNTIIYKNEDEQAFFNLKENKNKKNSEDENQYNNNNYNHHHVNEEKTPHTTVNYDDKLKEFEQGPEIQKEKIKQQEYQNLQDFLMTTYTDKDTEEEEKRILIAWLIIGIVMGCIAYHCLHMTAELFIIVAYSLNKNCLPQKGESLDVEKPLKKGEFEETIKNELQKEKIDEGKPEYKLPPSERKTIFRHVESNQGPVLSRKSLKNTTGNYTKQHLSTHEQQNSQRKNTDGDNINSNKNFIDMDPNEYDNNDKKSINNKKNSNQNYGLTINVLNSEHRPKFINYNPYNIDDATSIGDADDYDNSIYRQQQQHDHENDEGNKKKINNSKFHSQKDVDSSHFNNGNITSSHFAKYPQQQQQSEMFLIDQNPSGKLEKKSKFNLDDPASTSKLKRTRKRINQV